MASGLLINYPHILVLVLIEHALQEIFLYKKGKKLEYTKIDFMNIKLVLFGIQLCQWGIMMEITRRLKTILYIF
jgi:hypothetical protein